MTARRLPHAHLLLTAVIAVFLISFVFGIQNLASQYRTQRDKLGDVLWIAAQLERDYLQFLLAIERHALQGTSETEGTLLRRFDVLLSRMQLFEAGESGALLATVPEIGNTVARLRGILLELDAEISQYDRSFDLNGWRQLLDTLNRDIHISVLAAFVEEESYTVSAREDFRESLYISAVSLIAILISGGALIVLSIVQARRAERAELASRQARLESERARREAEQASRAKSDFLARMSHELRTPLNAILGFSEVVEREVYGPVGDKRYLEYLSHIHESGSHLLSLINDILDLSRVEAGRFELREEEVELPELIASTVQLLAERAEAAMIRLQVEVSPGLPTITADWRALRQVLVNLLSNALKYTPAGGRVRLSAERLDGQGLVLTVADTGIGIPAEDIPKVLQPFGRAVDPLTRDTDGCGLGLSITKQLVELHGGSLQIESPPEGGTAVRVLLPAERALEASRAA